MENEFVKGWLIDPYSRDITPVTVNIRERSGFEDIRNMIECEHIDVVRCAVRHLWGDCDDDMWVDDSPIYNSDKIKSFTLPFCRPIFGKAILLGNGDEESKDSKATSDFVCWLKSVIRWEITETMSVRYKENNKE